MTEAAGAPDCVAADIARARALSANGRWTDAAGAYQAVLTVPGEHLAALMPEAGRAFFKSGRYQEALSPLSEAVLANPADRKAARRLALTVRALSLGATDPTPRKPEPLGGAPDIGSDIRRLLAMPEPELCELVRSGAAKAAYHSAMDGLTTGRFMAPERAAESGILEKIVVAHALRIAPGTTDPVGPVRTLDDLIVGFLRSLRGYLVVVYAMSNTGTAHLNFSLVDCNTRHDNIIVTFHYSFGKKFRLSEPKIRKACVLTHCIRLARLSGGKVKIVSTVRDPLARIFAVYMYNEIRSSRSRDIAERLSQNLPIDDSIWQTMSRQFENQVINFKREDYFSSEIGQTSGIDISGAPVDMSRGYAIVRQDDLDLLLLRTERMEECAPRAFEELLGQDVIMVSATDDRVRRTRMRDNPVYEAFRSKMRLNATLFEELYGQAWVRNLFSVDEIAAARDRWRTNLA